METNAIRYIALIILGSILFVSSLLNVFGVVNLSSDLFVSMAGLGLIIEGFIERKNDNRNRKKSKKSNEKS